MGAKNTTVSSFDYFYSYIEDVATKILFSQLIATLVKKFKFCMSKNCIPDIHIQIIKSEKKKNSDNKITTITANNKRTNKSIYRSLLEVILTYKKSEVCLRL